MLQTYSRIAAAAIFLAFLAGCGDDDSQNAAGNQPSPPAAEQPAAVPPAKIPAAPQQAQQSPVPPADIPSPAAPADEQAVAAAPGGEQSMAGAPLADGIAAATPTPPSPMEIIVSQYQLNDYYTALLIDAERVADPHDLTTIALELCTGKDVCQIGMWGDPAVTPQALPVKVSQLKYQLFTYGRNKTSGYEASLWNCTDYPELEDEGCIPKPLR